MANVQNLTMKGQHLSRERAQEIGSKGGKMAQKRKAERKAMKEQMLMLLSLPLKEGVTKESLEKMGIADTEINNQMAIIASTYKQAVKGNMNAVNVIREIIGERVMEVNVNQNIDDKVKELNELLENE